MAFAGPPEDDIDWADVSPGASAKFLARAWRAANDVTAPVGADFKTGDAELRKATQAFLRDFNQAIEGFKFNVGVAKIMELINALRKAIDGKPGSSDPACREAAETAAKALSLFAPYTAEDMWQTPVCWSSQARWRSSRSMASCATRSMFRLTSLRMRFANSRCRAKILAGRSVIARLQM